MIDRQLKHEPGEILVGHQEKVILQRNGLALDHAVTEVVESPTLQVLKKHLDVLMDMVQWGNTGIDGCLDWMFLEGFSNPCDSIIL